MTNRDEIIAYLDTFLEKDKFEDYLPIGLLVEGKSEVSKVATAVSVSQDFIDAAAQWGADMLLVHHGIFWKGEDPVLKGYKQKRLAGIVKNDMTLLGYHLPLDAHPEVGNNALFAEAMGFQGRKPFCEYKGNTIGWQGSVEPMSLETFIAKANRVYGGEPKTILDFGPSTIRTAAVVSGGAWDHIQDAFDAGADLYVTGNADEPVYHLARELGVHFLAYGHHATERIGIRCLGEVLTEKFGVENKFFDADNPL